MGQSKVKHEDCYDAGCSFLWTKLTCLAVNQFEGTGSLRQLRVQVYILDNKKGVITLSTCGLDTYLEENYVTNLTKISSIVLYVNY